MKNQLNIVICWVVLIGVALGSSFDPDRLSREQIVAVSQLRELVSNEEITQNFMTEDYYLAKVLDKNEFDLERAQKMFREILEQRKELKLDTITKEDFGDLRVRFPFSRSTLDKFGRPVLYRNLADWEVNKYLNQSGEAGKDLISRYKLMMLEESAEHIRALRAKGSKITAFDFIINAAEYSLEQHYASNYRYKLLPDMPFSLEIEKIVVINTPSVLEELFLKKNNAFKQRKELFVYGQDQAAWKEFLAEFIDEDQFPEGILKNVIKKDNNHGLLQWL